MSQYKIVIDSCGELSEDLKADGQFLHSAAFAGCGWLSDHR